MARDGSAALASNPCAPGRFEASAQDSGRLFALVVDFLDPRRRLIAALLLVLLGILRRGLHDALGVMRGCVDRIEPKRLVPGVLDVMPGAGGHLDAPAVLDVLLEREVVLRRPHLHAALAGIDTQELIGAVVHLEANRTTGLD